MLGIVLLNPVLVPYEIVKLLHNSVYIVNIVRILKKQNKKFGTICYHLSTIQLIVCIYMCICLPFSQSLHYIFFFDDWSCFFLLQRVVVAFRECFVCVGVMKSVTI